MYNRIKRAAAVILAVMLMIPMAASYSFAAAGVSVSGGDNIKGGDTFTLKVTFKGGNIGRVDGGLTYDTDRLTYISGGSSSGNSGYVQLTEAGTGEAITFNLKFRAVKDGITTVNVSTNEVYDLDEREMSSLSGSKSVNIVGSAASDKASSASTEPTDETSDENIETETQQRRGVDEKPAEKTTSSSVNVTAVLAIAAAVVAILLVIVAVALKKSRKKAKKNKKHRH